MIASPSDCGVSDEARPLNGAHLFAILTRGAARADLWLAISEEALQRYGPVQAIRPSDARSR
jgi:hypothetical protein